jgi:hypothetical protein
MTNVFLFALLTLALLGALYWLSHLARRDARGTDILRRLSADSLLPQHYKYFPQVCRALSAEDARFLESRATPATRRAARQARRTVALQFLTGLRDDYQKLDRLARVLASLAPSANQRREVHRMWLAFKFGFRWRLIWLEIWYGAAPVNQLQSMAGLIGGLAAQMQASMNALQESTEPTSVSV